jgi:hypothetical protein
MQTPQFQYQNPPPVIPKAPTIVNNPFLPFLKPAKIP